MFKILSLDGIELDSSITLSEALEISKRINSFVTIKNADFELCGKFGVDEVKNGVCPDGIKYDWNKESRIGAVKRR